jgi:hypothetical protein
VQFAAIVAVAGPAPADTLCNFPGHNSWNLDGRTPVESAAWFDHVAVINPRTSPPTVTNTTNQTIYSAVGNIIRVELFACNSLPGPSYTYAGTYRFRDEGPQPNWSTRDDVGFDKSNVNTPVLVGRYFQQVGSSSRYEITPLLYNNETQVAQGPSLTVRSVVGVVASGGDVRGPRTTAECGNLAPGQYSVKIAEDGDTDDGVWDNLKGGPIGNLTFVPLRHRIMVKLVHPENKDPIRFQVGDPVTIEGAVPNAYNGDWKVTEVKDALNFTTTGPDRLNLELGSAGTANRYYQSGDALPRGIGLAGYVEICVGTPGTYYATSKLESTVATPPMKTVRWESESHIPGTLPANTVVRVKFYQTMPCVETGDLKMWPRIVMNPGNFPDSNIVAEGTAFTFHVVDNLNAQCRV